MGLNVDDNPELYFEWMDLLLKHVIPKKDSTAALDQDLQFLQLAESPDFETRFETCFVRPEDRHIYSIARSMITDRFKERISKACLERDSGFFRRLLEAVKMPPRSPVDVNNLSVTGTAVLAWFLLYEDHRPNRWQLRALVEQWRGARISDSQWADTLREIKSLVR